MARYFVGRREVFLDDVVLGQGGEALVKRGFYDTFKRTPDNRVYKLWKPGLINVPLLITKARHAIQLVPQLPEGVIGPQELLTDDTGAVVGYSMIPLPDNHVSLDSLTSSGTWRGNNLTQEDIVRILINLHDLVSTLHKMGIVIGDLNPDNFSFILHRGFYVYDVDAWQFGSSMPCVTTHIEYLSPLLYRQNPPRFLPEHDWWAFTLTAFRTLMRIQPYLPEGEVDTPEKVIPSRVTNRQHVLSTLSWPATRFAFPPKVLPTRTLELFANIFNEQRVQVFPKQELEWLLGQFQSCFNHRPGRSYARERSACPVCANDTTLPVLRKPAPAQFQIKSLSRPTSSQTVVFTKTAPHNPGGNRIYDHVFLLTTDAGRNLTANWVDPKTGGRTEHPLGYEYDPDQTQVYDVNRNYILFAEDDQVLLFTHYGREICQFTTDAYNGIPVAGLGQEYPVWVHDGQIVTGKPQWGTIAPSHFIMPIVPGSTWFGVGTENLIVGYIDREEQYWFAYVNGMLRHNLPLQREQGEILDEASVVFGGTNRFAIFRRTSQNTTERLRLCLFEGTQPTLEGVIPETNLESAVLTASGMLLLPTQKGILRLKQGDKPSILPGTAKVPMASRLSVAGSLFLTTQNGNVYHATR